MILDLTTNQAHFLHLVRTAEGPVFVDPDDTSTPLAAEVSDTVRQLAALNLITIDDNHQAHAVDQRPNVTVENRGDSLYGFDYHLDGDHIGMQGGYDDIRRAADKLADGLGVFVNWV